MHYLGVSPRCELQICPSVFVQTAKLAEGRKCGFWHGYVDCLLSLCERNIIQPLSWRQKNADWLAAASSEFALPLTAFSIWISVSNCEA